MKPDIHAVQLRRLKFVYELRASVFRPLTQPFPPCTFVIDSIMPLLDPGTPSCLPILIAHLNESPQLQGWNFDPTLLSVLLFAFIIRRGGAIIDVLRDTNKGKSREGVRGVVRVVSEVCLPEL